MQKPVLDRRDFLTGLAAVAASVTILRPAQVFGEEANSKLALGVIGCGGRAGFLADLFKEHGGYQFVAAHDYFADRANALADKHQVPADRRYSGLAGYKKLLESKLDAVVITSPPYFHPEHAAAAVAAGRHVYVAKPVAVDVPGCQTIAAAGRQATEKKQAFLVDFQTRSEPFYAEAIKRVREGAIGEFAFGESCYHTDRLDPRGEDKTPEGRLRNWVFDKALSGDIITEQNIHTLDVMSWIMDAPPGRAWGTCGRKVRTDVGDCNDWFTVTYEYAQRVGIAFSSRQFNAHGTQPDGIRNRMFGTLGVLEATYGGQVLIRGKNFWRGGSNPGIYKTGATANIAEFHKQIREGRFENPTVAPSVQSNLVTLLGRAASYTGQLVTWEQLLKSEERLDARLNGLQA
jgi:myo-inositol 2-dehydrogenase/D-chiro-inositol 1-dehydrogenase